MHTATAGAKINTFHFPTAGFDPGITISAAGDFSVTFEADAELVLPDCRGYGLLLALKGGLTVAFGNIIESLDSSFALLFRLDDHAPCIVRTIASSSEGVFISFKGEFADKILGQFPQNAYAPFPLQPDSPLLRSLIETASDAQSGLIDGIYKGAGSVFQVVCHLCARLEHAKAAHSTTLADQTMALIHERYAYLYGVEDLAESIGVSKHHLIREFTRATGGSPGRYLTQIRIENAKHLLAGSDYGVELIGQLVGYSNGNYFCKAFKNQTGMTPKEYRNSPSSDTVKIPLHILDTKRAFV